MKKMVTRTVKTLVCECTVVDKLNKSIRTTVYRFPDGSPVKSEELSQNAAKFEAAVLVTVDKTMVEEDVYGVDIDTFMAYATKIERPLSQRREQAK